MVRFIFKACAFMQQDFMVIEPIKVKIEEKTWIILQVVFKKDNNICECCSENGSVLYFIP